MNYCLRDGLSFCDVGGRYIFLDIAADRYFVLGRQDNDALAFLLQSRSSIAPLSSLGPIGSLLRDDRAGKPLRPTSIHRATKSMIDVLGAPVRGQYLSILYALAHAQRDVRCEPLAQLVRNDRFPPPSQAPDDNWLADIAGTFERVANGFGREKNCLPRSLALWRFLRKRGHFAQIVFGVKDLPFSAHCWVQSGNLLLNDRLETVTPFTPVLVR